MKGLKGKVAIVTGGATLLGAQVVRAFQQAGTRVMIADLNAAGGGASRETTSASTRSLPGGPGAGPWTS